MLNPFVCGTFHHEDDELCLASPGSSPRKSKRKDSRNNNPYSTRGLDRFSALLADLDEKRQKIYSQMSPQDISFVRFVHSSTDDFVPIVVKVKNNKDQKHKSQELRVVKARHLTPTSESMDKSATESTDIVEEGKQPKLESDTKVAKKRLSWNMKKLDMWRPSLYLPMVVILILVFLTVFGRSVATLCTCILWYVIPTLKDRSSNPRKSMKKKDYVRGLSEKKIMMDGTKNKDDVRGLSEKKMVVSEGMKKKEYVRGWSEKKMGVNEGMKKKDYVRGWSEKKMVVNEGMKKKDYVRGWSEKIGTDSLLSPRTGDSEASKNESPGKHSHKKSW